MIEGYCVFETPVRGVLNDLSRADAELFFRSFLDQRSHRMRELKKILSDRDIDLGTDERALSNLSRWYIVGASEGKSPVDSPDVDWYSIAYDLAIYLGEEAIKEYPILGWELYTKERSDISYQHVVLAGLDSSVAMNGAFDIQAAIYSNSTRAIQNPFYDENFLWNYWNKILRAVNVD